MKRPLAVAGFSMMFSIILSSYLTVNVCVAVGAVLLLFSVVGFAFKSLPRSLPTCVLFCAVGMLIYAAYIGIEYSPLDKYDGQECEIEGIIIEEPVPSYDNVRYTVRVSEINSQEADFIVRLTTDGKFHPDVKQYDRIRFTSTLHKPANLTGAAFNNRNNLMSEGIAFTSYIDSVNILIADAAERPAFAFFSDIRRYLVSALQNMLGDESGIATALMLGDQSRLTQDQRESFSMIGVSHLFAVSGLHLSVLLAMFMWLARKARLHRIAVLVSGIILILMFMGVTGFSSSVIRAGVMNIIILVGMLIFREADGINSLGAAILVLILTSPLSPLGLGFQMSVLATAGLILISPEMMPTLFADNSDNSKDKSVGTTENDDGEERKITEEKSIVIYSKKFAGFLAKFIVGSIVTSISANIFLLPIYSFNFGAISILMPLANLLLVPAGSAVLVLSLITSLLYFIPGIGQWITLIPAYADKMIIKYIDSVSRVMSSWEWQKFGLSGTYLRIMIVFILIVVVLWLNKKTTRISGVVAATCCGVVFVVGVLSDAIFTGDLTTVHFWGNSYSSCVVINADGRSISFGKDGYYADMFAEQFRCLDGCFAETEVSKELQNLPEETFLNGWRVKTIEGSLSDPALILQNGDTNILFLNSPDETVAQAVLDEDIYFDIIFFRETKGTATHLLTSERIGETVILCDGLGAVSQTDAKLIALSYYIIDISDSDGAVLTLSSDGKYSLKK